jgi:hypothetical protein
MAVQMQVRRDTAAAWIAANPMLASGEGGLETDTNKLKYGDGATLWNALGYFSPPGGSGVGYYGVTSIIIGHDCDADIKTWATAAHAVYGDLVALCDGVADEVEINAAIAALVPARTWMETVKCIGNFICAATINMVSYTTLDLTEAYISFPVNADTCIQAVGTIGDAVALVNDEAVSSRIIEIADTADFSTTLWAAGNFALIRDETIAVDSKKGEIHRVMTIVANTSISIDTPLWQSFDKDAPGLATVVPISMQHHMKILGGHLVGVGPATDTECNGIIFTYCTEFEITGLHMENFPNIGIGFAYCTEGRVHGNWIWGSARNGYGYGIANYYSTNMMRIDHNDVRHCTHCIACDESNGSAYGAPMFITIESNTCINDDELIQDKAMLDCHEGISQGIRFLNNVCEGYQGIGASALSWEASGNVIRATSSGIALRSSDTCSTDILLRNNLFLYTGGYAIVLGNGTIGTVLRNVEIDGVFMATQNGYAAVFIDTTAAAHITVKNVHAPNGNTGGSPCIYVDTVGPVFISSCVAALWQRSGISVTNAVGGLISGNVCYNNDQAGATSDAGIYLDTVTYVLVTGNSCFGTDGKQDYGVKEVNACDNNTIIGNKVYGNATAQILKVGAATKVRDNDGYTTENYGPGTLLNANTTVVVNHGCAAAPTWIGITWKENPSNLIADWWIDTITATQFTLNGVDPGASNLDFMWEAKVR